MTTIVGIGLLICAPFLAAETVMVSIYSPSLPAEEKGKPTNGRLLLSALEDGIMDEFFSAGHIAFNAEIFTGGNRDGNTALRSAKEGGATRLLSVLVAFPDGGGADFERAEYSLVSVADRRTVSSGTIKAAELKRRPDAPRDEFFADAGRAVAKKALAGRP